MRLITYIEKYGPGKNSPRVGALLPDNEFLLDFTSAMKAAEQIPDALIPDDIFSWFDLEGSWLQGVRKLYQDVTQDSKHLHNVWIKHCDEIQLVAPVPRPGKIICVGLNYRDHAAESRMPIPESPMIFSKFGTAVIGECQPVVLPTTSTKVDYEAELAVVIGRRGKHISGERAMQHVLGYSNFNDVSARDFQFADGQWQRGKSCDTFAPLGPYIATSDEIPDPHKLSIKFHLNGKTLQDSNTSQLIFGVPELIAFISETITLEPGDVIATGTPSGVGFARNPPVFLKPGDVMEVEIEGLGKLNNTVESGPDALIISRA